MTIRRKGLEYSALGVLRSDESTALTGCSHPGLNLGPRRLDTPQSSERREIEGCTQVSSFLTLKRRLAVWLTGNSAAYSLQNSDNGEFRGGADWSWLSP
jgi:hypothetical protein